MSSLMLYGVIVIIIALVLWLLITKVLKNKNINAGFSKKVSIDINALLSALGGLKNIRKVESRASTITFTFYTKQDVNIDILEDLGATGIVYNDFKLTAIFGKASKDIAEAIEERR